MILWQKSNLFCLNMIANHKLFFFSSESSEQVMLSFDVFFDLRLNKQLSRQSRRWWFGTPLWSLWRHCNGNATSYDVTGSVCVRYDSILLYWTPLSDHSGRNIVKSIMPRIFYYITEHISIHWRLGDEWNMEICPWMYNVTGNQYYLENASMITGCKGWRY